MTVCPVCACMTPVLGNYSPCFRSALFVALLPLLFFFFFGQLEDNWTLPSLCKAVQHRSGADSSLVQAFNLLAVVHVKQTNKPFCVCFFPYSLLQGYRASFHGGVFHFMNISLKGFVMFQVQNVEYAAGKLRHTEDLYLLVWFTVKSWLKHLKFPAQHSCCLKILQDYWGDVQHWSLVSGDQW